MYRGYSPFFAEKHCFQDFFLYFKHKNNPIRLFIWSDIVILPIILYSITVLLS